MTEKLLNLMIKHKSTPDDFPSWLFTMIEKHSEELSMEDFAIYFLNLIKTQTEEITRSAPSVTTTPRKSPGNADSLAENFPSLSSTQQTLHETTSMCLETREIRTSTPIKSPGWGNSVGNQSSTPNSRKTYSRTICLADFLMSPQEPRGRKNKATQHARTMSADQVKPKRRVVPLSVPKNPPANEQFLTSSFRSDNNLETLMRQQQELERTEGREDERFLLKMHKDLISQDFESEKLDSRSLEPVKSQKVTIDLSAVTNSQTLNLFACIYSTLIDWNLMTNVLSELAFLLNLLNADFVTNNNDVGNRPHEVFKSANNCVFFAFGVLNRQRKLLALLDAPTIRILLDYERISQLQESLHKFLTSVHRHKVQLISSQRANEGLGNVSVGQGNVFYQQENDTRENFPSAKEFAAFKNQRDGFYTILKAWEVNHLNATWDFSRGLAPKVRQLLAQLPLPVNMAHLAKLFTAQLIISCSHEDAVSQLQDDLGANVDIGKLSKLSQRLTAPGHSSAELQFPGVQVFFRDFIIAAEGCCVFVEQLKFALIAELTELNDAPFETINFSSSEENLNEFNDVVVNPDKISTMRTLAKFLGFTMSRPFPYENGRNSVVDSQQIALRNSLQPQFDVKKILLNAMEENKLLVTIPWLVEYLSMLDHVTMQLDYYRSLMDLLYKLHVNLGLGKLHLTPTCLFILRLCLGWLFDRPNILADDYYDYRRRQRVPLGRNPGNRIKNGRRENERSLLRTLTPTLEAILNAACPFLGDFRLSVMPTRDTKTVSRTGRYRHITTKLTTESPKKKSSSQDAQKLLIDAFLQSQSPSMRKIVDFVTERVTSAAIKNFQVLYFLDIRKGTQKEVREIQEDDHEVILKCLHRIYGEAQEKLNKAWDDSVPVMIAERVIGALDALLAIETPDAVKKTCGDIVKQRCLARAEDWRTLHSKEMSFLHDDLTVEAIKIAKNIHSAQQGGAAEMKIDISGPLPSDVFEKLQQFLHTASMKPSELSGEALLQWLEDLKNCLAINTFVPQIYKTAAFMLHELMQITINQRCDLVSQEVIQGAIACWQQPVVAPFVTPPPKLDAEEAKSYVFAHLFHILNIENISRKSPEVQRKFLHFLTSLIRAGFVSQHNLLKQTKNTNKWPEEAKQFLSRISKEILGDNSKKLACHGGDCDADDLANIVPDLHL
ncbi:protein disks lost isoform X2 [Lutzomyia longipalpis]|uniref:protein disks lost isoform X2 n=1 Tax=Lutzomyia longipalpis TaxID=7200 RepID=UPI002483D6C8|nr:protein disks lost isoform X2 [Lutzomyia longipalpis]